MIGERIKAIIKRIRKPADELFEVIFWWLRKKVNKFRKKGKGKDEKKETKEESKKDMKGKDGVTDVDRKKHKEIAKEIKERLNKPLPQKPKTFEEFYKIKKKHAKHLTKTYQKQLKKKVKLSIDFEDLKVAEKRGKVKMIILIRANDLHDESFIDDDLSADYVTLTSWGKGIFDASGSSNVVHFLKGREVPKMLFDRIQKVQSRGGQKLTIEVGPNSYRGYPHHTAYIKQSVVDGLQKGDKTQFDALTHEIDHAVRFEGRSLKNDELFKALKSEIFALHTQMFTVINSLHAGVKTVKFYNIVVLETYMKDYNKKFKNKQGNGYTLDSFLLALSKEDKNAWITLTEYIAFCRYILVRKTKNQSLKSLDYQKDVKPMANKYSFLQDAKKQYNLVRAADKNIFVYFTEP